jgi:hypothetical protein
MVLGSSGALSMRQIADEFGLGAGAVKFSQLYREGGIVPSNSGSNAAVPSAGALKLTHFRGTASLDHDAFVTVTIQATYADVVGTAQQADFEQDAREQLAARVGVPVSKIVILSLAPGSIKVAFKVRAPATGQVNAAVATKLATVAAATSPTAVFGAAFCAKYNVGAASALAVTTRVPPQVLLGGVKVMPGVAPGAAPTAISVADLFSTTTPGGLTYGLQSGPATALGSVALAGSTLSVTGAYRGASYPVHVVATDAVGTASAAAVVSVTELAPPAIAVSALPAITGLTNSTTSVALSSYFSDAAYGSVLAYSVAADGNPEGSAFAVGGTLTVAGANRGKTYSVTVRATNQYGATSTATVSVTEATSASATPVIVALLPAATLTSNTLTVALGSYFAPASGDAGGLSYALTANPQASASLSGSTLTLTGAYRNASYAVEVTATSASGGTARQTLSVTEGAPPLVAPVFNATVPTLTGTNTSVAVTFAATTFLTTTANVGTLTWSLTSAPTGVTINGSTGVITAAAATAVVNQTFTVAVTGPAGTASKSVTMNLTTTQDSVPVLYPPVGMTATGNNTVAGQAYGDGTYVVSSSTFGSTFTAHRVFDRVAGYHHTSTFGWVSASGTYNSTSGVYLGNVTTTVSGTAFAGEWIQIQMPTAIMVAFFKLINNAEFQGGPRLWVLAGSNDGSTWSTVKRQSVVVDLLDNIVSPVNSAVAYNYFRFIVIQGGARSWVGIDQLLLYGASSVPIMFMQLSASDVYSRGVAVGNVVSTWNDVASTMNATGAGSPYLRYDSTKLYYYIDLTRGPYFSWPSINLDWIAGGGITIVAVMRNITVGAWERLMSWANSTHELVSSLIISRAGTTTNVRINYFNASQASIIDSNRPIWDDTTNLHVFAWTVDNVARTAAWYKDGVQSGGTTSYATPIQNVTTIYNYLGRGANSDPFLSARLAEFRIYKSALPAAYVTKLSAALKTLYIV